ncbi:MAG: HAMP domain-containing histidine kinase, partial [Actinobacteria bacterium]|nr:HAMP domain-containing histidine kinase [Actinomycetota bacterium]
EIDRAKNDFVAAITHELKTPLTSLLGYASILRKRVDALPKDRREQFFEIIQRQGERILKLIGDLLDSSRMESGLAKLSRERIDIAGLIKSVVAGMKPAAKKHTVRVDLPSEDPGLYGDPSALEHVLTNLLDNALKYSPKKTTVHVWTEVEPSELRINVSDEGLGIPPEDLPHIFERFRQGDGVERSRNSVGLGLFIVRSLVEAQGGRVSAISTPGRGSTFTIAFPRRAEHRSNGAPENEDAGVPAITIGATDEPQEPTASIDAETLRAVASSRHAEPTTE